MKQKVEDTKTAKFMYTMGCDKGSLKYIVIVWNYRTIYGRVLTNSHDKASAFNKYFSSVGTRDDGTVPECLNVNLSSILENVSIDEGNVLSSINKLKCSLSAGPDNLPPLFPHVIFVTTILLTINEEITKQNVVHSRHSNLDSQCSRVHTS